MAEDNLISDLRKLFKFIKKPRKKSKRIQKTKSWLDEHMHR